MHQRASTTLIFLALLAIPPIAIAGDAAIHDPGQFQGRIATMQRVGDGAYRLQPPPISAKQASPAIDIARPALTADTNSVLFDGLFALAQQEMRQDQVDAIRDPAFDNGKPLTCDCYQTGAKWPYVWTRDVSFSADLALARLDPERMRRTLRFKLSGVRAADVPAGRYVAQDTGSGGSWPVSTDRVVWFLAARHLLDDAAFADDTYVALRDTLAQDRVYAFDADVGLYRGETSFLDWREQTYPAWTANDVRYIADSFALSTNVLHYEALTLAAQMATKRSDAAAAKTYRTQADALARAIDGRFWNAQRRMYMSYVGTAQQPMPIEAYDLLGISLAALSGAVPEARARQSLANYPATAAGSPVIWPQQPGVPIYHNRAIWPFVSAYALKAARRFDMPERIAHETRSLMRGAALAGSNMENYEFTTLLPHVDDGTLSGPVVNSPRQLWSVAGYLDMVLTGVFGVEDGGRLAPKIPMDLVPELFGERDAITLRLADRTITLKRPAKLVGNLLVAGDETRSGRHSTVQLRAVTVAATPLVTSGPQFAPSTPDVPVATRSSDRWRIVATGAQRLYVDGASRALVDGATTLPLRAAQQCISATRIGADGIESLPSPTLCVGDVARVDGAWPRLWTATHDGRYSALLRYDNRNGPVNTGVTAAVKQLVVTCGTAPAQTLPIVMPHSIAEQASTSVTFNARRGQACTFDLKQGANMSALDHFARYTGGAGGATGPLNEARVGVMKIALAGATQVVVADGEAR